MSIQTKPPAQPYELDPVERAYIKGLYHENASLPDSAERDEDFEAIAELVGDIALSEKLQVEALEDRLIAEGFAYEFKVKRATEAAKHMEIRGYAETAPNFGEQLLDESRTAAFSFNGLPSHMSTVEGVEDRSEREETETEGLKKLDTFLRQFLATTSVDGSHPFPQDAEQAQSMLDNLTFIGEKEFREAAMGLGMLWKMYLDGDPARKLCVLTAVSDGAKYKGKQKSDAYLRDKILETFSDADFDKYNGRIVGNIEDIETEDPSNVRIVLLDDWTISGQQLSRAHSEIVDEPDHRKFLNSVEINLLVASEERLSKGFRNQEDHPSLRPVKVRAYYKAHHAEKAQSASKSHVSGLHSTVNFDFGNPIEVMVKRLERLGKPSQIPSLASVVSPYKKGKHTVGKS